MSTQIEIPGYTIVSKIAEGGMATVWKARQEKLERVVAVKILEKKVDGDDEEYNRFIYEARAAATLIHPNIVQVIDAGERDGFLYYIMEYVPGPTAGDVVSQGTPMPETQILQIALEVSEALDYAWRDHKVVHCDIKPENLLLHRNGRTKIADLGLAQVLGGDNIAVEEDMTLGTPNYFPPEQALVEEGLDCRADMYALGASLWHMGTGEVPFHDLEPEEVASMQVHGQLENPKKLNGDLSWAFCCLVEKLMAKDVQHRHSDWAEVMADIHSIKSGRMIKSPLASNVRSTVLHTKVPEAKTKKAINSPGRGNSIRRAPRRTRGSSPARGSGSSTGGSTTSARPVRRRSPGAAAVIPPTHHPKSTTSNIWPLVTGLGLIVILLYAFTFLRIGGGF